jgi:O-acetylhomoserine/O-acetylserine sulfhydrylase-like pyridoxal-dependent enzyme
MISQGQTYSFRKELYEGVHNLLTDELRMALYTGNANLTLDTTVYSTVDEVVGTGYTAGGNICQNVTVNFGSNTVYVSFDNVQWPAATLNCRAALIYNVTKGNKAVAVLDFGNDKVVNNQTLTVTLPANTPNAAVIRSI